MNAERFAEIERVFQAAFDLGPDRRGSFLDAACSGDAELRAEVESLLAGRTRAGQLLEMPAAADRPATLSVGERLGPYEVTGRVGAGGMGEVYSARDTRLGRTVAIKILPPDFRADPARRGRFEREAKTIAGLNHPHICTLHDVGEHDGSTFLVMEHLTGKTLAALLQEGPLPLKQVLAVATEIADALAAAHRQGVTHRDLKPGNVMVTRSGAKLLDFGLAKVSRQRVPARAGMPALTVEEPATLPGAVMGTVPYMAPEQLEGGEADARTDLFAFGCLLYEMLTGRRAFVGDSEARVIAAIMASEPSPVSSPGTPPGLVRLVNGCLAKDPDERRQSAHDVAEELRGIARAADGGTAWRAPPARLSRRVVGAAVLLAVLLGVALGWTAFIRWSRHDAASTRSAVVMPDRTVLSRGATQVIALAPDGQGVVYEGMDPPQVQLYWHDLFGAGSWPLTGTADARNPFLSPDGQWVGFWRERDAKILKVPLRAGRVLEGSPASEVTTAGTVRALRGATWGDGGTIVYSALGALWRVAAAGGKPTQVTWPDPAGNGESHRWPSFLPGGRHVLFTVHHGSTRADRSTIAVLSLETGRVKKLVPGGVFARYLPRGHLVFARDGELLAVSFNVKTLEVTGSPAPVLADVYLRAGSNTAGFDVSANATLVYAELKRERPSNTLTWVDRAGRTEPVLPERQAYMPDTVALSPDGQRLAVAIPGDRYSNIWTYDLRDRRWQQLRVEADCDGPVWSPTGDRVAFESNLDGMFNIYVMAADGESQPDRLTRSRNQQWPCSWSPDGRYLAYQEDSRPSGGASIDTFIRPLDGDTTPRRWGPEGKDVTLPAFSPRGGWLAYQSAESGPRQSDVWVRPFPGPEPKLRVSGSRGFAPVWSSDGQEIFFLERLNNTTRIMVRRVQSTAPFRLGEPRVAFALPFGLVNPYYFTDRAFAVEPGGRRVLVVQMERLPEINALHVITNWVREVKATLGGSQREN